MSLYLIVIIKFLLFFNLKTLNRLEIFKIYFELKKKLAENKIFKFLDSLFIQVELSKYFLKL